MLCAAPVASAPSWERQLHRDEFVELVAWFWTEGHYNGSSCSLAQSWRVNPHHEAQIRRCLTALFGPPVSSMRNSRFVPKWREVSSQSDGPTRSSSLTPLQQGLLDVVSPSNKVVSSEFLSLFVSGSVGVVYSEVH